MSKAIFIFSFFCLTISSAIAMKFDFLCVFKGNLFSETNKGLLHDKYSVMTRNIALSPCGKKIYYVKKDKKETLILFDMEKNIKIERELFFSEATITHMAIDPNSKHIAIATLYKGQYETFKLDAETLKVEPHESKRRSRLSNKSEEGFYFDSKGAYIFVTSCQDNRKVKVLEDIILFNKDNSLSFSYNNKCGKIEILDIKSKSKVFSKTLPFIDLTYKYVPFCVFLNCDSSSYYSVNHNQTRFLRCKKSGYVEVFELPKTFWLNSGPGIKTNKNFYDSVIITKG